ncbi:TPA: DUF2570 domain-containing protein [Salmonella enterica subsp. enterica serovar Typhimurium]|jgi:hypothetical protein|uniref:DUF2570 domain-containing protein n=1 Tax=Enterobacteriaceae TaxID=543 RepID=UPI0005A7314A|nr:MULTISPECIES: DUF2570 domain-containing protein [Enterobacteriaceae]EDT2611453.1 DUF2570 domain-containing protein [Salmonella enterica subsp. enterica serovar 4,12:i:-]MBJ3548337.1 DUF2570 domain-containing protein [Salmonella enterica subsp. enterica serovar Indiana]MBJ4071342.1 DUF2570 domain-containing protein [Salmonella enterica subsp. enterica serovar Corvallis]MBJ5017920.1 DUF2570 domain-containing protein [Salmonella enterica subsp. enterica serovar Derby]MBS2204976.1 DUF2570 domai
MKLRYKLVIVAFFVTVIGSFIWSAGHYYSKYQHEKERADEAVRNAESATAITRNVLQSLQIINTVIEANQHAKQQIALESQRTQEDIKVAVADDDCAVRIVPSGAVKRLHEYANGIRVGAGRSVTSQSDG